MISSIVWEYNNYRFSLDINDLTDYYIRKHEFEPIDENDIIEFFYEIDDISELWDNLAITKIVDDFPTKDKWLDIKKGIANIQFLHD